MSKQPNQDEAVHPSMRPLAYDAYQRLADAYAEKVDTKPHNAYYERPAMLSLLPDLKGKRVLDAGCGPGAYAQALVAKGAQVVSIDISGRMLARASERLEKELAAGKVELQKVDLSRPLTMFDDESFDFVNAPLCLDYIEDWRKLFKDFNRILKPNGQVQFSCGHAASDAEHFKTKKYFSVEQVECVWRGFGMPIRMPSYRRSLEEIMMPVIESGFVMQRIHEPLPTRDFERTDLIRYKQLVQRPVFLCIQARKA